MISSSVSINRSFPMIVKRVARTAGFAVRVFSVVIIATVPYSIAVSKLRRPLLSDFLIAACLLRRREKLAEPDFALLGRDFNRARREESVSGTLSGSK
jgi:predicted nucleic acid-binding protein